VAASAQRSEEVAAPPPRWPAVRHPRCPPHTPGSPWRNGSTSP